MRPKINNDFYDDLGESWYSSENDSIAILRIEQVVKNPWVKNIIKANYSSSGISIADIGCGAGFLTNYLAKDFDSVYGLDCSESTLEIAKAKDSTKNVNYVLGDAYKLPFSDSSLDVVCAMDFLEHVEEPDKVISECSRVLKTGGIFLFHTFNRNFLSWLIIIKFMEWFVPNYPKNLHVLHLFIKPKELESIMAVNKLLLKEVVGLGPRFNLAFFKSIFSREIKPGFGFNIIRSTALGYMGFAKKS